MCKQKRISRLETAAEWVGSFGKTPVTPRDGDEKSKKERKISLFWKLPGITLRNQKEEKESPGSRNFAREKILVLHYVKDELKSLG